MRFFVSDTARKRRTGSHLALAIALATGAAVGVTSFAEPAYAQKKKKKKDEDEQKPQYSDEFRATYVPFEEAMKAEPVDYAAVTAMAPGLIAVSKSPHEQLATGTIVYNAGIGSQSNELRLQGMEMMLGSGLLPADSLAQYNAIAFELTRNAKQYEKARNYGMAAISHGFTAQGFTTDDLRTEVGRLYFVDEKPAEGIGYLLKAINERKAEGGQVPEQWYRLATTQAYEFQVVPQVYDLMHGWVLDYPSEESWQSSIAMVRNLNDYSGGQTLDSVRLGFLTNALLSSGDYLDLVESVSPRRRPQEAKTVINTGIARGLIDETDPFAREQLGIANEQIERDKTELPSLERDAFKDGAPLRTVTAAADTLLSYGMGDKAAQLYEISLQLPGVDRAEALTRKGMAQIAAGDYEAAQETLASVEGPRFGIANLWAAYAKQQQAKMSPAPAIANEAAQMLPAAGA